jgi:hypothetical protein
MTGGIELTLPGGSGLRVAINTSADLDKLGEFQAKAVHSFTFIDVNTEEDFALMREAMEAARECVYVDPAARKVRTIRGVKS